jgi:hypothetical protein
MLLVPLFCLGGVHVGEVSSESRTEHRRTAKTNVRQFVALNSGASIAWFLSERPDEVVVNRTRIISAAVLMAFNVMWFYRSRIFVLRRPTAGVRGTAGPYTRAIRVTGCGRCSW